MEIYRCPPGIGREKAADASLSLALAVVASSSAPIVLLDGHLCVIAASTSFYQAFLIDPKTAAGKRFSQLGEGEWNIAQLSALLEATAAGMADVRGYEMDLKRPSQDTRRLVLSAQKLDYADTSKVRLCANSACMGWELKSRCAGMFTEKVH